jgi:myb proto-oncogene protein
VQLRILPRRGAAKSTRQIGSQLPRLFQVERKKQCRKRWHNGLDSCIDQANSRTGTWSEDEDSKLKDAVHMHGGKNWAAISALVLGRTKIQCTTRWHHGLVSSIDPTMARTGTWSEDEDSKLKDAVQTYGGKNWAAIASLVPGRTKIQCRNRWSDMKPNRSIDRANEHTGSWTIAEDSKLKNAVRMHGSKNWVSITELVPSRTKKQCCTRWHKSMDPNRGTVRRKEQGTLKYAPGLG